MKIEFSREEVEAILLAHANEVVKTDKPFNKVDCNYSYIPDKVTLVHEPTKEETE
jgi:hypothetical protein